MSTTEWSRVLICQNPIEVQAVVGLLESEGIPCRVRDLSVRPYPVSVGPLSERHIEVPTAEMNRASVLLAEAREDGYLDGAC